MLFTLKLTDKYPVGTTAISIESSAPIILVAGQRLPVGESANLVVAEKTILLSLSGSVPILRSSVALSRDQTIQLAIDYAPLICSQVGLDVFKAGPVRDRLATTFAFNPGAEAEVARLVAQLELLEGELDSLATDPQSTLIRADVLEWEPGGKIGSVANRRSSLVAKLISAIGIGYLMPQGSGGGSCGQFRTSRG